MYYWLLRVGLQTIGRLSDGIRLGWRTGFDSGVMLEYIYENQPRGITPLGVWFDRMFIAHPVWDGVRSRRQFLIGQLQQALSHYDHPLVVDLAAGVGSYLFTIPPGRATIIAGDYEPEAVAQGQDKANRLGRTDITFQRHNAFVLSELASDRADILVASGFFDILTDDQQIQTVLQNGSAITPPGARWVFTIQEHHPDLKLLKQSLVDLNQRPWELVPRPAEQLVAWAEPYGWHLETLERNQFFAVGTLVKQH
ncbi:MAG: class I SAM-dependent methyltransferase family protein [Cyanobacteria bacterium]|nr:class I SAM-dependent methyltransferase family protein [Cyanobacteriota bacterium]MDW8200254.1 class I SAM-dependent methyltransferase family protein [Cyanobacteriota bacterium SKYGB_h_bin112]